MPSNLSPYEEAQLRDLLDNYESMKRTINMLKWVGKFLAWVVGITAPIVSMWIAFRHGASR